MEDLIAAADRILENCKARGIMVATAESCTGGLVSAALTAIAGSSAVVERGFVTYSNQAKNEMLGVPMALIEAHGAVSEEVARAMAEGALSHSRAHRAVAITGVAGPGHSDSKPAGLVHFALARQGAATLVRREIFDGDRTSVRHQAAQMALELLGNDE